MKLLNRTTSRLIILALVGLFTLVALVGCGGGSGSGDVTACKAAMASQYASATADPSASPATQPQACAGLSSAQLQQLAGQVLSGQ